MLSTPGQPTPPAGKATWEYKPSGLYTPGAGPAGWVLEFWDDDGGLLARYAYAASQAAFEGDCCIPILVTAEESTMQCPTFPSQLTVVPDCGGYPPDGDPVVVPCCDEAVPRRLYVTFAGSMAALGTVPLDYSDALGYWDGGNHATCEVVQLRFACISLAENLWQVTWGTIGQAVGLATRCYDPFLWSANGTVLSGPWPAPSPRPLRSSPMPRPCGHDTPDPGHCRVCFLHLHDGRYATLWGSPPGRAAPPPALSCVHLGGPLGETRSCPSCKGSVRVKVMACAVHGGCTPARKVEGVAFCGTCPDRDLRVVVPEPPALALSPASDRAIVTVAAGPEGKALLDISRPWMARYAARLGADFVVIDWEGHPYWPMAAKFQIHRAFDHYERIIYLDADTLADPDLAPDLFGLVPAGRFGAYNDQPGVRAVGHWRTFEPEYRLVCRGQKVEVPTPVTWYCNTGIMVLGREHRKHFRGPEHPIQPFHCSEQHLFVGRLQAAGVVPCYLPARCNFQFWQQGVAAMRSAPKDHLLHFSGSAPSRRSAERLRIMKQFAGESPMTFDTAAWASRHDACPGAAMDLRHVLLLYDLVRVCGCRRVVEVGMLYGSVTACSVTP